MTNNIFEVVYLIGLITGIIIRVIHTRGYKKNKIADESIPKFEWVLMLLLLLGMQIIPLIYLFTPWLDFANYHFPIWAGCFGALTFGFGLWLLWYSHADLELNWSPTLQIREKQVLVTWGVYRYIRHPMYAAHFLWAIAQFFLLQNLIAGWGFLIAFLPLYYLRVPKEEEMMLKNFEEYREYMNRTNRIIPAFWKYFMTVDSDKPA